MFAQIDLQYISQAQYQISVHGRLASFIGARAHTAPRRRINFTVYSTLLQRTTLGIRVLGGWSAGVVEGGASRGRDYFKMHSPEPARRVVGGKQAKGGYGRGAAGSALFVYRRISPFSG
ncbi:hypothetical protein EVAR_24369_1 [Eumeta japonica]|uniref:Uncharacterized protein n=1 Tax=Eumeta variegata TaxID=151549 RepID=A0A4C1Y961_EUMVA|nr:hypothetical protein EVAR_24369_1 [Eumeta japonica]